MSLTPDAQPSVWVPLTFPDPSPAPIYFAQNMRNLRNIRPVEASGNIVNVVHTAQMIPVLISLIHSVLETANVREEIDQGIKDARGIARDAKEAIKNENERWDKERKDMEDVSKNKVDKNEVTFLFCIFQHLFFMVIKKKKNRIKRKERRIRIEF